MAEVVLFHHVQGLTDGVREFAEELRAGGHTVHTPDLFDGQIATRIEEGLGLTETIGENVLGERADRAVADLPKQLVYGGLSFGAASAQRLAQDGTWGCGPFLYRACSTIYRRWPVA